VRDVIVGGKRVVEEGRHIAQEAVLENYRWTIANFINS
jgi:hypothetical protein